MKKKAKKKKNFEQISWYSWDRVTYRPYKPLAFKEREDIGRKADCFFKFSREKMNLYEGVWIKLISRETLMDEKNEYGDNFKAWKRVFL